MAAHDGQLSDAPLAHTTATNTPAGVRIALLEIPETWDEDSAVGTRFRDFVDVRNAIVTADWGGDATHEITAREAWGSQQNETDEHAVIFIAEFDGAIVGRASVFWSKVEAEHLGQIDLLVLPRLRRRGIGSALWREATQHFADHGRSTVQSWIDHFPTSGPRLSPPTGFGSVPANDPGAAFASHHGFVLEQVERISAFDTADTTALHALYEEALGHAEGYEIDVWNGATPVDDRESLAALHQRMSVDAPSAGLDHEEEQWDVDRLLRFEQVEADRGRTVLRAVARHPHDGIVAYTTLVVAEPGRPVYQDATLVHGDHRGHRLGMLVKIANLRQLAKFQPGARVLTWNAEENRPMLSVNEAIGFTPIGYQGAWQLHGVR